jgi:hypothetical protein
MPHRRPRVYADFQSLDDEKRVRLSCGGSRRDLETQKVTLRPALILTLYGEHVDDAGQPHDVQTEGVVEYNEAEQCWVAVVNWQAIRHAAK